MEWYAVMRIFIKRVFVAMLSLCVALSFSAAFAAPSLLTEDALSYDQVPFYFEDVLSMRRSNLPSAQKRDDDAVNISAISLEGFIVGIDAGHQRLEDGELEPISPEAAEYKVRMTGGCKGARTGAQEYSINLIVAKKLQALLEGAGATVVMTRTQNDVSISNAERAKLMNDAGANLWIRVHCNSSKLSRTEGASILAPSSDSPLYSDSAALGKEVLSAFCTTTGAAGEGIAYAEDQVGFNYSESPVVAIEMGYLSNPQEEARLCRDSYQALCAKGIFAGIALYLSGDTE